MQTLLYAIAVRPTTRAVAGNVYRWAQRAGLIRGSISTEEYGRTMPADYLSRGTNLQAVLGMAQLEKWERNRRHREQLTSFYLSRLERLGVDPSMLRLDGERPALLMVPVLVENKGQILRRAAGKGLPIGTWFDRPPAHIQEGSAPLYDYTPGQCPCTERLISKEIHLLTGPWVRQTHANKAIRFLERHACLADPSRASTCVDPARADMRRPAIPASSQS
jgi:dTDP-4-amino-4,6-dideoxygalactose transaminase